MNCEAGAAYLGGGCWGCGKVPERFGAVIFRYASFIPVQRELAGKTVLASAALPLLRVPRMFTKMLSATEWSAYSQIWKIAGLSGLCADACFSGCPGDEPGAIIALCGSAEEFAVKEIAEAAVRRVCGREDCGSGSHARAWGCESGAAYADQGRTLPIPDSVVQFCLRLRGILPRGRKGTAAMKMWTGKTLPR